jgi:hypothetical protein
MSTERNHGADSRKVPDDEARRLLARAAEIESAQSNELSLSQLREAALEAGIAPNAFEQAVVEFERPPGPAVSELSHPVQKARSRFRTILLDSARTVGIVLATLFVIMMLVDLIG